jgi:D-3-phosphoglycerate dehydrogenase
MKVLVADKLEKSALDGLAALGCEVVSDPNLQDAALHDALVSSGAEVLVVRSTKVPADVMDGSSLRMIVRAGAGYNTIDVDAATERGIWVTNCPGKNAIAVAELAFGLILSLDRFIPDNVATLNAGKWDKKGFGKGKGLFGRTLGLVGFGSIGKEMVPRAIAFGMDVLVFSGHLSESDAAALGVRLAASLGALARESDVVSVHVSMRPDTKAMLGKAFFDEMKPGAFFVNTSRGEVVVQSELLAAVESGRITAGLDVFDGEPTTPEADYDGELRGRRGVYVTHHIGASTEQAQEAVAAETVRIVEVFKGGGTPPNAVNEPKAAAEQR